MKNQDSNEIANLKYLNERQGSNRIVRLFETFVFRNHVCATFELLGRDLYRLLRENGFHGFSMEDVRTYGRQLLEGLQFIHSRGVVHCDLKPENVCLVTDARPDIRLIDFGSSFKAGQKFYEYVQSRFYRAPEIFLGLSYGPAADMWSFGCFMSEFTTGRPIFSGETELQQIKLYIQAIGLPGDSVIARAKRRSVFFWPDGRVMGDTYPQRSIREVTGILDADLIELLERCLEWDQHRRITASEALKLPYFAGRAKRALSTVGNPMRAGMPRSPRRANTCQVGKA
jgi:dual specificity tyrosine-phosphorylation-regulated kinase 2/3/4